MIPNLRHIVEEVASAYPVEWRQAHTGSPQTDDWIKILAWTLHQADPRFGLNGKRGNPSDISDDAICFDGHSALGDVDPTRGGVPVTVLDVIGGAGGPNPTPQWGAVGPATPQPHAAWVRPVEPASVVPPPDTSGVWTPAHDAIRVRMVGRPARQVAEQLGHAFPAEQWGEKRTRHGDWSPDTIGRLIDGRLWAVKLTPLTIYGFLDASDHVFRAVAPVNHLGDAIAPPPPPPPPVDHPPVVADYTARFDAIDAALTALADVVARQRQELIDTVKSTPYKIDVDAGVLGRLRGTITPQPQS